jgi:aspartate/methionine/tyrosine aminotransferase
MANPPKAGVDSPEVVERHQKELRTIYEGMKMRAKLLVQKLNTMSHIQCDEIEGALYAFPSILLTESAIAAAKERNITPDQFFCAEVLKNTGLVTVPGGGFKQRENTFHFRITILIYNTEEFVSALDKLKAFTQKFFETYP